MSWASGIAAAEVLVEAARLGHRVEGRVGDEPVDLAAHQQPLAAVDLGPLHGPLGHGRVDVAGVRVGRLVVVVVGVEGGVVDAAAGRGRRPAGRSPTGGLDGGHRQSSPRTRRALVRRNLGHTSSLNPTSGSSVMIRSMDRPIGK